MKSNFILDEWDSKIVRCLKGGKGYDIEACMSIWRDRSGLPKDYACLPYIVDRMAIIVEELELAGLSQVLTMISPEQQWKYGLGEERKHSYIECCFYALASIIANTRVVDLPGYIPNEAVADAKF